MTDNIDISPDRDRLDLDYIHSILKTMYWAEGIPREMVEHSINHSVSFGIYKNQTQIGFARVITDCTIFAYLADVFIDPQEQGKGYGRRFIHAIVHHEAFRTVRRWHLLTRDAHWLYEKFGFTTPSECHRHMERTVKPTY